jgi:ATP-dependent RNA helicase DDX52/ROK1
MTRPHSSATGSAVTFFTEDDAPFLRPVANLIREAGGEVPEWMLHMKKLRSRDRKHVKLPPQVGAWAGRDRWQCVSAREATHGSRRKGVMC